SRSAYVLAVRRRSLALGSRACSPSLLSAVCGRHVDSRGREEAMSKHTPGPWQVEVTRANLWIGTPKGSKIDDVVCDLEYGEEYKDNYRQRQLANANLIAAAPEMYEALDGGLTAIADAA